MRNLPAKVDKDITTYRNVITNPGASLPDRRINQANLTLREDASELTATAEALPLYQLWAFLGLVPSKESVEEASDDLTFLSNNLTTGDAITNDQKIQDIEDKLNI